MATEPILKAISPEDQDTMANLLPTVNEFLETLSNVDPVAADEIKKTIAPHSARIEAARYSRFSSWDPFNREPDSE
jgi:hypothetical protein